MNKASISQFLPINIGVLRRFQTSTCPFDFFKEGVWKSYSGVYPQVQKLSELGLITWVHTGRNSRGCGNKKFYMTLKGQSFLELFPEDEEADSLWEAIE
jgi:hypothetical protein